MNTRTALELVICTLRPQFAFAYHLKLRYGTPVYTKLITIVLTNYGIKHLKSPYQAD